MDDIFLIKTLNFFIRCWANME